MEDEERLGELGLFILEKICVWGLINVYKHLTGGNEKEGTRLLSVTPSDRTIDNGH